MPALPDVPQVVRFDMRHSWAGDNHLTSRFFVKYSGGAPSDTDCASMANFATSAWISDFVPLASTQVALQEVTVTDLTTPSSSTGNFLGPNTGTRAGQPLSINDCVVLNFQIARRYRGGKPRMYGPWGIASDMATDKTWDSTLTDSVNTAWTGFMNTVLNTYGATTLTEQVNVSYYHGFTSFQNPVTMRWYNVPLPRAAATVDTITGHVAATPIGSQRRRIRAV